MNEPQSLPTVARTFATTLRDAGVTRAFGIPGGGTSPLVVELDKVGIEFVLTHGETSAVLMASTEAEASGSPGVALTSLGPGAAAATNGVAHCFLDRVPLLLVTDRLSHGVNRDGYHQWIDQAQLFQRVTKASFTLTASHTAETLRHAICLATAGPPGPVHVDLSKSDAESQLMPAESKYVMSDERQVPISLPDTILECLRDARRPILLAGLGARRLPQGLVGRVAESLKTPVLTTYKGKGAIDETAAWAAGIFTGGVPEQALLSRADLVLSVGLDEVELLTSTPPLRAERVAIDAYSSPAGVMRPPLHQALGDLAAMVDQLTLDGGSSEWTPEEIYRMRSRLEKEMAAAPSQGQGVHPWDASVLISEEFSAEAEVAVDAGAHMLAIAQAWRARRPGSFWISNGLSTMGYALPAGIARSAAAPDTHVVCCTGDGGLLMVAGELATASRVAHRLTIVVFDDRSLSLIRIKQVGEQVGRGVDFKGPNWIQVAEGFGVPAEQVSDLATLRQALRNAKDRDRSSMIVIKTDPSPYRSMIKTLRG